MFKIQTLNNISLRGLERLPRDRYEVASELVRPDALLVRSADVHSIEIPASVLAVARAGAGTNNIPVAKLSERGIPVFNAPGANANAVKELVLAGLLLAARNICQAWGYVRSLEGDDHALEAAMEQGKKKFVGYELPGRTLGVVGLGAIGVEVANAALHLGMKVLGYDPQITVQRAWQLSSGVEQALSLDDLFARCDVVTVHVPLNDHTRGLVNASRIALMRKGSAMLNFARGQIVDEAAVLAGLDSGQLSAYVCDFPTNAIRVHPRVRGAAAPRRIDGRSRGELRDHGGGHAARVPRKRQRAPFGQLSRGGAAAGRRQPPGHRQRERAQHGRPDLDLPGGSPPQHRRPAQQVAGRHRLHAARHGRPNRAGRCG